MCGDRPLEYFAHDAHAASDPKCRRLMRECGVAGYGRFWLLCEALASEPSHSLPVGTEDDLENAATLLDCDDGEEAAGFLRVLERLSLVVVDGGVLRSPRMDRNADRVAGICEKRRAAALKRWAS